MSLKCYPALNMVFQSAHRDYNFFQGHSSTYIVIFKDICAAKYMAYFRSKGINKGHSTVSVLVNPFCRSLPMFQINGNLKSKLFFCPQLLNLNTSVSKNNNYDKTASKGK